MSDEQRYTLAEAKLELNREECERYGHDYEVYREYPANDPQNILCRRCGASWVIGARVEQVKRPEPPPPPPSDYA